MVVIGMSTGKVYGEKALLASAGEGAVYTVDGDNTILLKILTRPLTQRQVEKLKALAAIWPKPEYAAIPIEVVIDPSTGTPVGFVQPYFSRAIPLTRVLDSHGRSAENLPNDLAFRVKLCRLLAEAFARVHAANLVVGDVSDGNFMLGRDWFGRVNVIYTIDCNSFQVTLRTNHGNEFFPSGVATEEYTAPEVQLTDWATSQRTVYSDSFGLAVLAWKILFGGSNPFAVITPRSVDVPPLGERIEKRLFPFCPGTPMPANWKAPAIQPSLAVLPIEVRVLLFRAFSSADPRDRATAMEWCETFRAWELALTPSLPLRLLGAWNGSFSDRLAGTLSAFKPYLGRAGVFATLVLLTIGTTQVDFSFFSTSGTEPYEQRLFDSRRTKPNRPRTIDAELFPEPIWQPSSNRKE